MSQNLLSSLAHSRNTWERNAAWPRLLHTWKSPAHKRAELCLLSYVLITLVQSRDRGLRACTKRADPLALSSHVWILIVAIVQDSLWRWGRMNWSHLFFLSANTFWQIEKKGKALYNNGGCHLQPNCGQYSLLSIGQTEQGIQKLFGTKCNHDCPVPLFHYSNYYTSARLENNAS